MEIENSKNNKQKKKKRPNLREYNSSSHLVTEPTKHTTNLIPLRVRVSLSSKYTHCHGSPSSRRKQSRHYQVQYCHCYRCPFLRLPGHHNTVRHWCCRVWTRYRVRNQQVPIKPKQNKQLSLLTRGERLSELVIHTTYTRAERYCHLAVTGTWRGGKVLITVTETSLVCLSMPTRTATMKVIASKRSRRMMSPQPITLLEVSTTLTLVSMLLLLVEWVKLEFILLYYLEWNEG